MKSNDQIAQEAFIHYKQYYNCLAKERQLIPLFKDVADKAVANVSNVHSELIETKRVLAETKEKLEETRKRLGRMYIDKIIDAADFLNEMRQKYGHFNDIPEFQDLERQLAKVVRFLETKAKEKLSF